MKAKTTLLLAVMLILSAVFVAAQDVPVEIISAEIDNSDIEPFGVNQLDIERGNEFTLRLELMSMVDVNDVEFRAFISGYEFNDVKDITARMGPFDMDANVTYVKKMKLSLPDDLEVDDYQLRIIVSDRWGEETIYNYELQISTQRHAMKIEDVVLSPGSAVKAGQAVLATVRVENKGQKTEDDVKVMVSVPALGLSATEYIDEVEADEEEETEELFLRLPRCVDAGVYDANVDVWFNDGHDKVSGSVQLSVLENEACSPAVQPIVIMEPVNQTIMLGAKEAADAGSNSTVRSALEVILLVLVALLVVVGLIVGFSRMRSEE